MKTIRLGMPSLYKMVDNREKEMLPLLQLFPFETLRSFNPLPDDKILDWSKLKQIADDILKIHLK